MFFCCSVLSSDTLLKGQAVQTDTMSQELGVNTDTDWESQAEAMLEYGRSLTEQYDGLRKTQGEEEVAHEKQVQQLQRKKEEAIHQHQVRVAPTRAHAAEPPRASVIKLWLCFQALLEKLDSVRVKLQLNNSKSARKNFSVKHQELTAERSKAEEERNR